MPANPVNTGAIDTSPIVLAASDTLYPDDRKGALARIDNLPVGATVDDIFYFSINGEYFRRVIDGPMRASYCGVFPDGTDQTANLAAAFAAGVKTIVFDNLDNPNAKYNDDPLNPNDRGVTYIINGTLNLPAGTMLKFYPGSRLAGTGTINKGLIDADHNQQIFKTTLTINPEGATGNRFSVKWYGARGDNYADDYAGIQTAIELVIRNNAALKTVWFPNGIYKISNPLIAYRWDGADYINFTICLEGDGAFWNRAGLGPEIRPTFRNTFAIGIQNGKGCTIKGLQIMGGFVPPVTGEGFNFFSCAFADFVDGVSRDNTFSPYSGIVIDPFARSATQVADPDKYPGLESYYRGTGSASGSTGFIIEDVVVNNFVVGICFSPNGKTLNAELMLITKYQFNNIKLAISGGQAQEKMNKVQFAAGWSNVHTVFATGLYGAQAPGNWYIEELNLAGNVNRLIYNNSGGYFPIVIKKVFAEMLGTFGTMNSLVGASVEDCEISFVLPRFAKFIQYNIDSSGVRFSNSNFRYYEANFMPISIKGTSTYENVTFNAVPFIAPGQSGQAGTVTFLNCTANTYGLGISNTISQITNGPQFVNASPYAPLGSFKTYNPVGYDVNGRRGYTFKGDQIAAVVGLGAFAVAVSGEDRQFVINLPLNELYKAAINVIVGITNTSLNLEQPFGIITAINATTGDVTVSYAAKEAVNGSYFLKAYHPLKCGTPFIGDVTVSTNTITNVKIVDGIESTLVGSWIKSPMHVTSSYVPYIRITNWNAGTKTLTVSAPAFYSAVGTFFCNEGTQYHHLQTANSLMPAGALQKGGELSMVNAFGRNGVKQEYVIAESGFLDPVAASDTRRAYYLPKDVFDYTGNPEGNVAFPSGAIVRNINTGEVYVKATTDSSQLNGGKNGWVKQRQQLFGAITADTAVLIPTGDVVGKIVITSTTTQSGLLIGTTPGGSELATINFTGAANAGVAVTAAVLGTGSTNIYLTNIAGTVNYRVILE